MTVVQWIGLVLLLLAVAWIGLAALGSKRWARRMAILARRLESARSDGTAKPSHPSDTTRYDLHELEGLPAPVQRYFRAVLTNGQDMISRPANGVGKAEVDLDRQRGDRDAVLGRPKAPAVFGNEQTRHADRDRVF